jgi:VIT1/CCC1 family predicted Fe2+/Mn2+ transporter
VARRHSHVERHQSTRIGWLRAAVLGSNDAIVSTASLMIGVHASSSSPRAVLIAGVSGLVAGSMSMAVGEYVSVSSQRDSERADIELEKRELAREPQAELRELEGIYLKRGLDKGLAAAVARQLSAHDRLGAHLRDELGLEVGNLAKPMQAALESAASFAIFAALPIAAYFAAPLSLRGSGIVVASIASLAMLGALGGRLGGAPALRAAVRVALGGGLAMGVTAAIGHFFGAVVQ